MDKQQFYECIARALNMGVHELSQGINPVCYKEEILTHSQLFVVPNDSAYYLKLHIYAGVHVVLQEPVNSIIQFRYINLIIDEGAQVTYKEQENVCSYQFFKVSVAAHATFFASVVQTGEGESAMAYECTLQGVMAAVSYEGRVHAQGASVHRLFFYQIHTAPDTTSTVAVKTVAQDTSTYRYEGTIVIEKNAIRSAAHQQHKALILSPQAQVSSIPNLEVHTHQVACGHGAAIAHLDADHLFYLASRGLSYEQSKRLIVQGFLN